MALFIRLLTILCVPGQAFKCCPQSHFPLGPLNVIAQSCIVRWFFRNVCHVKSELTVLNSVTLGQKWPSVQFSSVQSLSRVRLFATPWIAACQASLLAWSSLKLLEFTQTHIHRVGDAIQPSHFLSSPFPPAPNPSQHQSLFQWVNSSHEVAKVLEFQL